ncbi:hypothetical protein GGR56DRAFT_272746 [Xylariaceae sp. FL0804]|nr:hypothetical protein GGR56DRAFT_272746 [Xylariaceae sp. FL0804]
MAHPYRPHATRSNLYSHTHPMKRVSSGARIPAGHVEGDRWTHDLHGSKANNKVNNKGKQQPAPNSLAARIHAPGTPLPRRGGRQKQDRTAKLTSALNRTTASPNNAQQQINFRAPPTQPASQGMSIKGLAGPFAVLAQNFAPGTTAADIESAMTPVGGPVVSCRVVKTHPIVIAEIIFEEKEGADRVIETFDNQTADGRMLNVYLKPGAIYSPQPAPRAQRSNETRAAGNSVLVDGKMGWDDPMDTEQQYQPSRGNNHTGGGALYSDSIVRGNQSNGSRRGGRYSRPTGR